MSSPLSVVGSLLSQFMGELASWQAANRFCQITTTLGDGAFLVERLEGLEHLIGAPLPEGSDELLPDPARFPVGSLVAQQADLPQLMLGHTPVAPALNGHGEGETDDGSSLLCGYRFLVTVVSAQSGLDLNSLLGTPVLLQWQTASSGTRPIHGHISEARALASNGGLARYQLVIEPWLSFLRQQRDSWVYQNMSVADILQTVFDGYQGQGKLNPAVRIDLADDYPTRSLLTQYRETDWHFVRRLIVAEGLACWFEHEVDPGSPTLGIHTLVISDRKGLPHAFNDNAESPLRYHRADVTEQAGDSFQGWRDHIGQQPSAVRLLSYDDRAVDPQIVESTLDVFTQKGPQTAHIDHVSHYAWCGTKDGERRADNLLAAMQVQARHIQASGTVRSLAPGQTFELSQHYRHPGEAQFRCVSVLHQARNNLSADFHASMHQAFGDTPPQDDGFPAFYRNQACCLYAGASLGKSDPIDTPFAPQPERGRYHSKPTVLGVQTATVVGQPGSTIDTDRNHRVKVQFHWQRGSSAHNRLSHPSGDDNAPADDSAWAWVRVGTPQAGPNWGASMVPRVGQEVLVAFLDGDIDRPVILGAAYNGQGNKDAQHNQMQGRDGTIVANAPAWFQGEEDQHAHPDSLAGIKTQAMSQSQEGVSNKQQFGFSQLVFDDHPQSPRVEIGTTQAQTWMQFGHLRHYNDNARREARGHGISLETQGHAAVRGGMGLLLSAYGRPGASGSHMDVIEGNQTVQAQSERLNANLTRAGKHQAQLPKEADPGKQPVEKSLQDLASSLNGNTKGAAAWGNPDLIFTAPKGVGWLTSSAISLNASNHFSMIGRDLQLGAQATFGISSPAGLRVFAGGSKPDATQPEQTRGLQIIAASGKMELQAQKHEARINAKQSVTLSSKAIATIASPTSLKLAAQGAGIEIKGGNITIYAPNGAQFLAGQKKAVGAAKTDHVPPNFAGSNSAHFALKGLNGKPMVGVRYRIKLENGRTFTGYTNDDGETAHIPTVPQKELALHLDTARYWSGANFVSDGDDFDAVAMHHDVAADNELWQSIWDDLREQDDDQE